MAVGARIQDKFENTVSVVHENFFSKEIESGGEVALKNIEQKIAGIKIVISRQWQKHSPFPNMIAFFLMSFIVRFCSKNTVYNIAAGKTY